MKYAFYPTLLEKFEYLLTNGRTKGCVKMQMLFWKSYDLKLSNRKRAFLNPKSSQKRSILRFLRILNLQIESFHAAKLHFDTPSFYMCSCARTICSASVWTDCRGNACHGHSAWCDGRNEGSPRPCLATAYRLMCHHRQNLGLCWSTILSCN